MDFHRAVVESTHNAAFVEVYRFFSTQVHEVLVEALGDREMPPIDLETHRALVDAIGAGDPDAAERVARRLLQEPIDAVSALLADR